jgi:transcriptional activator of cad operon
MERSTSTKLRIGTWSVNPASNEISRGGETFRLELRSMRLLLCLAEHAGEVVSIEDLLDHVWAEVIVSQDSVYQAVASLRRVLGDGPKQPTYIETVPRLGYRLIATVSPWTEQSATVSNTHPASDSEPVSPALLSSMDDSMHRQRLRAPLKWVAFVVICLVLAVVFVVYRNSANNNHTPSNGVAAGATPNNVPQPQKSILVLPFLDLTEQMNEEPFADGMTEELIDKLSKIPGLRVTPPTSSFYFKGKQIPVADIAKTLGVAYVLDGSVRKSGGRLRIAARLIRADSGYVVWTESYDRPFDDILMVQDEIASKVTKALSDSIAGASTTSDTVSPMFLERSLISNRDALGEK